MDDLEFVRRCTEKDAAAWDEFLHKYSKLIYNYMHSVLRLKGKDIPPDTVDDLYQEIIACLIKDNYKKLRSFRGKNGCSLASWLRIVTVNFMIDFTRRSKPLISLDEDLGTGESLKEILGDDSHIKWEDEIAGEEKQRQLSECIEELTVGDKYFLEFYLHRGLPMDRLSFLLRISKPAAEMRKSRIIERLRKCFEKRGFVAD
jgi:RNA polymerase sigma factor (sigma-70 family)